MEAKSPTYAKLFELIENYQHREGLKEYLLNREQLGIDKYGCHVDAAVNQNWCNHALEEVVDLMVYLIKLSDLNKDKDWLFFASTTLAKLTGDLFESSKKEKTE
jgi:hypothetical protein